MLVIGEWIQKQESFILHVCCRTMQDAEKLLNICKKAGLKRAGINSTKKIMIEIINTAFLNSLFDEKDEIFVNDLFLKSFIKEANENMENNHKKIVILTNLFKTL